MDKKVSFKETVTAQLAANWQRAFEKRHRMLAQREGGAKIQELADQYGCSKQRISAQLAKAKEERARYAKQ